jgi:very-short-patch-repair endonuclease
MGRNETWRTKPDLWRKLRPVVRAMRREPTTAEAALWERLRAGRLVGVKFRRQHPLDRFVVDFYASEQRLAVEVDGGVHDQVDRREADEVRDAHLARLGVRMLRVRNEAIASVLDAVLDAIRRALHEPSPRPDPDA